MLNKNFLRLLLAYHVLLINIGLGQAPPVYLKLHSYHDTSILINLPLSRKDSSLNLASIRLSTCLVIRQELLFFS